MFLITDRVFKVCLMPLKKAKVDTVIVKDLSRLGRNYVREVVQLKISWMCTN